MMITPDTDARRLLVREHQDALRLLRGSDRRRGPALLVAVALVSLAFAVAAQMALGATNASSGPMFAESRMTSTRAIAIDVGGVPTDVEAAPGATWVSTSLGTLVRIDPHTNRRVANVRTGGSIVALARGLGALWAIDVFGDRLLRVNPATNRIARSIPVDGMPSGLAIGHGLIWVASQLDSTVAGIDPHTGQTLKLARFNRGELWPGGLAVGPDGVWVVTAAGNEVSLFDPTTMTFRFRLRVPGARSIVATRRGAWVGLAGEGSLLRISGGRAFRVAVGGRATGSAPRLGSGACLWSASGGRLSRLDPSTGAVVGRTPMPNGVRAAAIAVTDSVWAIDPAHRTVLRLGTAGSTTREDGHRGCYALPAARARR